jgi:predicted Rossmann fold flavoprotein
MGKIKIAVVGGGAASFFVISNLKYNPELFEIHLFEKSKRILDKVRISGGGRCNVSHKPMEHGKLIGHYPRGGKSLLGPFSRFGPQDTFEWFNERGANLKIESDGRVFPSSNSSETIVQILSKNPMANNVIVHYSSPVSKISPHNESYHLSNNHSDFGSFDWVVFCPGTSSTAYTLLKNMGLVVKEPVPSLFTFQIRKSWFVQLAGISIPSVVLTIKGVKYISEGPLLFTHWGVSGPSVLKLSAFGAEELFNFDYSFPMSINWVPEYGFDELNSLFLEEKRTYPNKLLKNHNFLHFPLRFWHELTNEIEIGEKRMAEISKSEKNILLQNLMAYSCKVEGKSTFKEEFVTCGGLSLKEINLKTFELKKYKNFYVAGEILNIDAVTGGFNFQAAWTGAWHIAHSIASKLPVK